MAGYIVTSQGQTVRLFTRQGSCSGTSRPGDSVTGVSISPDAASSLPGAEYRPVRYNSGSGLGRNTTETVHDIRLSPVKDQIIVATAKALRSFNLSYVPNWYDDTFSPGNIAISGDGTGIVIPNGNHIRMYHGSGTLLWDRSFPGGSIISLAYSWDGSTIVAGRDDGTVLVLDRDGNLLLTANAGVWVTSVGVSDDGSTIATGSIDNQIRIFNREGTLLGTFTSTKPDQIPFGCRERGRLPDCGSRSFKRIRFFTVPVYPAGRAISHGSYGERLTRDSPRQRDTRHHDPGCGDSTITLRESISHGNRNNLLIRIPVDSYLRISGTYPGDTKKMRWTL